MAARSGCSSSNAVISSSVCWKPCVRIVPLELYVSVMGSPRVQLSCVLPVVKYAPEEEITSGVMDWATAHDDNNNVSGKSLTGCSNILIVAN